VINTNSYTISYRFEVIAD